MGTPSRIERYGAEAVPDRLRTNKWHGIFQILFGGGLGPALLSVPGQAVVLGGLSFWGVLAGVFIGTALSLLIGPWGASLGTKYGIPSTVGFRSTFGTLGAGLVVSSIRWLTIVYWFAFQEIATAMGISAILNTWLGWDINTLALTLALALFHIIFAVVGFHALQRLSRLFWPLSVLPCLLIVYLLATSGIPSHSLLAVMQMPARNPGFAPIAGWIGIYFGMYVVSACMTGADMSRYTKSLSQAILGFSLATLASALLATFTAAYAGLATGIWNPYAAAGEMATHGVVYAMLAVGLFAAATIINVTNVYSAGMALVNVTPRLGRLWSTVATGGLALVAVMMPTMISNASAWLGELGNASTPLVGVFLVDYVVIKRGVIDVEALFDSRGAYSYVRGINLVAVGAAFLGYAFAKAMPTWVVPQLAGMVASAVAYYVAARLMGRASKRVRVVTGE